MKRAPRLAHVAVAVVKHGETGQRCGPSTNAKRQLCSLCLVDVERSQRCLVFTAPLCSNTVCCMPTRQCSSTETSKLLRTLLIISWSQGESLPWLLVLWSQQDANDPTFAAAAATQPLHTAELCAQVPLRAVLALCQCLLPHRLHSAVHPSHQVQHNCTRTHSGHTASYSHTPNLSCSSTTPVSRVASLRVCCLSLLSSSLMPL